MTHSLTGFSVLVESVVEIGMLGEALTLPNRWKIMSHGYPRNLVREDIPRNVWFFMPDHDRAPIPRALPVQAAQCRL